MDDFWVNDVPMDDTPMNETHMNDFMGTWSIQPPPLPQAEPQPQTLPIQGPKVPNRRFTPAEWEEQKLIIQKLYSEDNKSLADVRGFLQQSGFDATEKQLKTKIKKWGLEKNINTETMKAIARTRAKRKRVHGKETIVRYHGDTVDASKVDRFMKRKRISASDLLSMPSPANASSPAFSVYTPHMDTPEAASDPAHVPPTAALIPLETINEEAMDVLEESPEPKTHGDVHAGSIMDLNLLDLNALDALDALENHIGQIPDDPPPPTSGQRPYQGEEDKCREALTDLESKYGAEDSRTIRARLDLGNVSSHQGRYRLSEEHFREVMQVRQRTLGADDPLGLRAFSQASWYLLW